MMKRTQEDSMIECVFCKAKINQTTNTCPSCSKPAYFGVELEELQYERLSTSYIEQIKVKGLFNGDLKKFIKSIADGNAWTVPVLVDESFYYTDNEREIYCANVSDAWGRPCESAVHFFDYSEFGDITNCTNLQEEAIKGVLLRYQTGKKMNYLLLSEETARKLPLHAKKIADATRKDIMIRSCLERDTPLTYGEGTVLERFLEMHGGIMPD